MERPPAGPGGDEGRQLPESASGKRAGHGPARDLAPARVGRTVVQDENAVLRAEGAELQPLVAEVAGVDHAREDDGSPGGGDRRLPERVVDDLVLGTPHEVDGIGTRPSLDD